jgi:hypothetical protein
MSRSKIISALVAGIYLTVACAQGGGKAAFATGIFLILPLACIWFADAMGGYTGILPESPLPKHHQEFLFP